MPLKISIIIPVYNVEKYLGKCLDSIINQTYKNIEIICVNDGSKDTSLQILEEYVRKDNRIKIINQQNNGVSIARNIGLKQANGEYILFVDADDWLEKNALAVMYSIIVVKQPDILSFGFNSITKNIIRKISLYNNLNSDFPIQDWGFWNRIYKHDFLKKNNIAFPINLKICEDIVFLFNCLSFNPKMIFTDKCLYNYLADREGSATKDYGNILNMQTESYKYLINTNFYQHSNEESKVYMIDIWARSMFNSWSNIPVKYRNKNINNQLNNFLRYFKLFNYNLYSKTTGFKRLKYKKIYYILKQIRNLFFKILYWRIYV